MLNLDVLSAVDTELARLSEMIPQERVEQIMNSGEKPSCWDTWECQRWMFTGMQCASLAVGVGKGLVKLTKVFARKVATAATKSGTKVAALTAAHTDDIATVLSHTGDILRFSKSVL